MTRRRRPPGQEKNPHASALSALGAAKGGRARAAKLGKRRLEKSAKRAASIRWAVKKIAARLEEAGIAGAVPQYDPAIRMTSATGVILVTYQRYEDRERIKALSMPIVTFYGLELRFLGPGTKAHG